MGESLAESLAKKVAEGTYTPSPLDACEPDLPLDQNAQSVRFVQFILFTVAGGQSGCLVSTQTGL